MYCIHCGAQLPEDSAYCTACGQAQSNAAAELTVSEPAVNVKSEKKGKGISFKRLAIVLCIPLLIFVGVLIFRNSGTYRIEAIGQSSQIVYRGKLEKLVVDDYGLLQEFIKTGKVDGIKVSQIQCSDYLLKRFSVGGGGTVDLYGDGETFFEKGLIDKSEPDESGYWDRFREDFVFEIETRKQQPSHSYYFQDIDDVIPWVLKNF